jgi:hypothetical protein
VAFIAIASFFSGILAAVGGILSARKDYFEKKIQIEESDKEAASKLHPLRNPYWLSSLGRATLQWLGFAAFGAGICFLIFPEGLSRLIFTVIMALTMGVHGIILAWRESGRELLKLIAHPPGEPSTFPWYLFREHILGNLLINSGINYGFGYVLYHEGPKHPYPFVKFEDLSIDILLLSVVTAVLVALTSEMEATADIHAGRTLSPKLKSSYQPNAIVRNLAYIGMGVCIWLLVKAAFWMFGLETFNVWLVMLIRGTIASTVATVACSLAAYWGASKTQTL